MTPSPQPIDAAEFFATARDAGLLSAEVAEVLAAEVATRQADPAQYVVEQGVMDTVAVDIVQTLSQPRDVADGYEVEQLIGRGGLGVVYRARQTALDRPVALKTILVSQMAQAEAVARFEREAKLVGRLRHPNIVVAYDFGRRHGRVYLVMELVVGEDLEAYIDRRGAVDEATCWSIVRQAAAGLAHAASHGVVHRDIKPSNLLLVSAPAGATLSAGAPMVKIADFGLARICNAPAADPRITTDGSTLGSPQYMAPEQVRGSDVDQRADIYALGISAFHMLTGAPPLGGLALGEILMRKTTQGIPRVDTLRAGLSAESIALVADMTQTDLQGRIGDYEQLLARIDRLPPLATSVSPGTVSDIDRAVDTSTVALADTKPLTTITPADNIATTGEFNATDSSAARTNAAPMQARSIRRWAALVVGALLLLVGIPIVILLLASGRGDPSGNDLAGIRYLPSGRGAALFDGEHISQWLTAGGQWNAVSDVEGGRVLSGRGLVRRRLPVLDEESGRPPVNYQLNVAVDLKTATAVELHFGILPRQDNQQPRYVLRAATDGVVLARRAGDAEPLEILSPTMPFPAGNRDPDEPDYHMLRVERHGVTWRTYFDALPVGGAMAYQAQELPEFRLKTEGGTALFDALHVAELVRPEP